MAKTTPKSKAWRWCSRYCRLRDALAYCKEYGIDTASFSRIEDLPVKCCTCSLVKSWIYFDAGHFISRSRGGLSGVYFDERNIHAQSKDCNKWKQGAAQEYRIFIIEKYGENMPAKLLAKHYILPDMKDLAMLATERYYKEKYEDLTK